MLRVVFFGNSEGVFSNRYFAALQAAPCDLAAVVDVPAARRTTTNRRQAAGQGFVAAAREGGVPVFEPERPNGSEFVETMRSLQPDLLLAVGYLNRMGDDLLATPRLLGANFHASLLPAYRGLHPVFRTLRAGERWAGLTVHVLDAGLDTGDILYQVRVRTRRDDSVATLYERIMDLSIELVGRLVSDADRGTLQRRPQGNEGASYFSSLEEEDFRIDWRRDAEELRRWIRTTPGRCFCDCAGERIYFVDAEKVEWAGGASPGTLLDVGRTRCRVAAKSGALALGRIRTKGGDEPAASWCKKVGLQAGRLLGE